LARRVGDGESHVPERLGLAAGGGADNDALGGLIFKFKIPGNRIGTRFWIGLRGGGKQSQDQNQNEKASDGVEHGVKLHPQRRNSVCRSCGRCYSSHLWGYCQT